MPLNTAVIRDGKPLALRWGGWHRGVMIYAVALDSGKGPFGDSSQESLMPAAALAGMRSGSTPVLTLGRDAWFPLIMRGYAAYAGSPLNDGPYTLQQDWAFRDPEDGEVLELKAGDVLHVYRD